MEKIKVNMSPNPLDVQTIHASQNDGEARQWEFELHNNGELIDTSDVKEQMVFKSYEGGTEQILPENGAVPVTAPFVGDIKYPDVTRTDQEFLYRQSPTEEDGNANIKSIYGNTLVWNQLVQNGNFADTSVWQNYGSTFTVSGNTATVKTTNASNQFGIFQAITFKANHKYFISFEAKKHGTITLKRNKLSSGQEQVQEGLYRTIETASADSTLSSPIRILFGEPVSDITNDYFMVKNYMIVDLTQMGLDSVTVEQFKSLFPLNYYAYDSGSLLNFNGNGIKTVGKNLFNINNYRSMASEWTLANGVLESNNNSYKNYIGETIVGTGQTYTLSFKYNVSQNRTYAIQIYNRTDDIQLRRFEFQSALTSYSITDVLESGKEYDIRVFGYSASSGTIKLYDIQWEIGDVATEFEPYTSSTLSLPISTYFPNGMKSAGTVYDELTPTKAVTRIGSVDLGSLGYNYTTSSGVNYFFSTSLPVPAQAQGEMSNIKSSLYTPKTVIGTIGQGLTENMTMVVSATGYVCFRNDDITSATAFNQAMSGVYLYYELATPTETSFTTASLVTENAEIPLSNNDSVLIGKCTEELSENPGFIDAKIKLSDSDGECYSNKIQLHVERSPQ